MTHAMLKGSNVQLETASLRAVLCWSPGGAAPDIDASALLLGGDGRVRSDEDFVFYNQPQHPAEPVRHLAKKQTADGIRDSLHAGLAALDASVERVMLSASSDGGTFADVAGLHLLIYGTGDDGEPEAEPFVRFDIEPETGSETAIICGELYRRGDAWKFRALGQGYETGLPGLATEFGISIESGEADRAADQEPAAAPDGAVDAPAAGAPPRAPVLPSPDEDPDATVAAVDLPSPDPDADFPLPAPRPQGLPDVPPGPPSMPPSVPPPVPSPAAAHQSGTQAGAAAFTVPGSHGVPDGAGPSGQPGPSGYDAQGPTQEVQHGYGYPQRPQHPPSTQPAYGYPQPAYGYPQPDPNFTLPPQGPQFIGQ